MFAWPNPAQDHLKFRLQESHSKVTVSLKDMMGKTMISERWQGYNAMAEKSVNISALPSGVYLVAVDTENGSITQKIIVE
jgi:hypothetical protein